MHWYLQVLKKYADFNGRARRKEYWMFLLFNMLFSFLAIILDNTFGLTVGKLHYGVMYFLYLFAILIPGMAVAVRRLHDVGKSGWMLLISLIPILGAIWLLILMVTDSEPGENKYGANPKDIQEEEVTPVEPSNDTIILLIVLWLLGSRLFWVLLSIFNESYYLEAWFKPINALTTLVWAFIPIALAFTLKDKSKQRLIFILGGIYLLYGMYETVMTFIR